MSGAGGEEESYKWDRQSEGGEPLTSKELLDVAPTRGHQVNKRLGTQLNLISQVNTLRSSINMEQDPR